MFFGNLDCFGMLIKIRAKKRLVNNFQLFVLAWPLTIKWSVNTKNPINYARYLNSRDLI